jgi:hypothetical protein
MSRNLNWTDNKVFGVGQQSNPSNAGVMGFTYQEKQKQQVSPATYAGSKPQSADVAGAQYTDPNVNQNVAGAQYTDPNVNQNVAGETYQDPTKHQNVAGAQYVEPKSGVAGAQFTEPKSGVAGAQFTEPKSGVAGAGSGYPVMHNPTHNQTLAQTMPLSMTSMPTDFIEQGPPPVTSPGYIPGYLKSLIGQPVRAEFSIGSNLLTDRTGIVREVGVNYFVLEDIVTRSRVMCDLYSVKFVTSL